MAINLPTLETVLAIQSEQTAQFGGTLGLREATPIKLLLARARAHTLQKGADMASLCALLGYGICHDALFKSANQPTALLVIELTLNLNRHRLKADDTACFLSMGLVAEGAITEEGFAEWLRNHITALL